MHKAVNTANKLIAYLSSVNDLVQLALNTGFHLDIVGSAPSVDAVFRLYWQTNPDKFNKSFTDPVEAIHEIHAFLETLRPDAIVIGKTNPTIVIGKTNPTLAELLSAIYESVELSSANELREAVKLIIEVQAMDSGMRDCIRATYLKGPLDDGDVPCKSSRDALLSSGYISKIVVKGEQGFNACTYKGSSAYKLIVAGA